MKLLKCVYLSILFFSKKNAEIDALQKLHGDHKNLQKDNTSAHHDRLKTLADVADENKKYGQFANDAAQEHSKLRDTIADKEHPLRVLRNEVAILGLENKNLQLVIDTEAALREAKGKAEIVAVTSVNKDLKDQTKRFEDDIKEERARKDDAHKILADLTSEYLNLFWVWLLSILVLSILWIWLELSTFIGFKSQINIIIILFRKT